MTWIDDRLAQEKARRERWDLIKQHADAVYEALWTQIVEYVAEAKSKSLSVFTTGSVHDRIVSTSPDARYPDQLHVTMGKGRIRAHGTGIDIEFLLDVCPDGVVCLKLRGEPISTEAAAIRILDPLLFPNLQG
jgi:hypothetical protein